MRDALHFYFFFCLIFLFIYFIHGENFAQHGLFWGSAPKVPLNISVNGIWEIMQGTSLVIPLESNTTVLFTYAAVVEGIRQNQVVSPFPREGSADTIQIRCLINNLPYRSSSSYASTYDTEATTYLKLTNSFAIPLIGGKVYNVTLQWKKLGSNILAWRTSSGGLDPALSFAAQADFRDIYYLQELNDAVIGTNNVWKTLTGNLVFDLLAESTVTISYSLVVQPQLNMIIKDRLMDFVSVRALVDGLAYTESSENFGTNGWNPLANSMYGSFRLSLNPGQHTVLLQWKKTGSVFKNWLSTPSYLDGFASARNLFVTIDKIDSPGLVDRTREVLTLNTAGTWSTVSNQVLQIVLVKQCAVLFNYGLPVTQIDNPNSDSFSWEQLSQVETRLVIDGVGYTAGAGNALTATTRRYDSLLAQFALVLPAGTHTAYLQWRSDSVNWTALSQFSDGFAHGERLLTYISSENTKPTISCLPVLKGIENQDLVITSVSIADIDEALIPGMIVNLNITVMVGTLSFPNLPLLAEDIEYIHGSSSSTIIFEDTVGNINAALKGMIYHSNEYWFGEDSLSFSLAETASIGYGPTLYATNFTLIVIESIDTAFTLEVPNQVQLSVNIRSPDFPLPLPALIIEDIDSFESYFSASFLVSCGKLFLDSTKFETEDNLNCPDVASATNALSFAARYTVMKTALTHLYYIPETTCWSSVHSETLMVNVSDEATLQFITKYMTVSILRPVVKPEVLTNRYPRWIVEGLISTLQKDHKLRPNQFIGEENYTTGYSYNVSLVDEWLSETNVPLEAISLASQGVSSNASELILLQNLFMEYVLNVQFQENRLTLQSSRVFIIGITDGITVRITGTRANSTNFMCELGPYAVGGIFLSEDLFKCPFQLSYEQPKLLEEAVLWLKFSWYDAAEGHATPQRYETNYVPIYLIEPIKIVDFNPKIIISESQSVLQIDVNEASVIDNCVFNGSLMTPAYLTKPNTISCSVPTVTNVTSLSLALLTTVNGAQSEAVELTVANNPVITSATIESLDLDGNFVLHITGEWNDDILSVVEFVKCNYDGYTIDPLYFAENSSLYCPLLLNYHEIENCCSSLNCASFLTFDHYQTNLLSTDCLVDHYGASSLTNASFIFMPLDDQANNLDFLTFFGIDERSEGDEFRRTDHNFVGSVCCFANSQNTSLYLMDGIMYGCRVPYQSGNLIAVTNLNGVNFLSSEMQVQNLPIFETHSPSSGPLNGGTFVLFHSDLGSIPDGSYDCLINNQRVSGVKVSHNSVGCYTPKSDRVGTTEIQLIFNYVVLPSWKKFLFNYTSPILIQNIFPMTGTLAGNQEVRLIGEGFSQISGVSGAYYSTMYCVFGDVPAVVTVVNDTLAICFSPYSTQPGVINLYFQVPAIVNIDIGATFTYNTGSYLLSATPSTVAVDSGAEILITGSGFSMFPPIYCVFDDIRVTAISLNASTLSCKAPMLSIPKIVTLSVANSLFSSDSLNQLPISFVDTVKVIDIRPTYVIGGKRVLFNIRTSSDLSRYRGDAQSPVVCRFLEEYGVATITHWNKITCDVFVPSPTTDITNGAIFVSIDGIPVEIENINSNFPIYPTPIIESVTPRIGSVQSSSNIVNFTCPNCADILIATHAVIRCRFDHFLTPAVLQANQEDFACFTPVADFSMTVRFGLLIDDIPIASAWNYSFIVLPQLLRTSVNKGSISGGQEVFIFGYNFPPAVEVFCYFGEMLTPAQLINSTMLRCFTPSSASSGIVSISALVDGYLISSRLTYEYLATVEVTSMSPRWAVVSKPTNVTFASVAFDHKDRYYCEVDNKILTDAVYLSKSGVMCRITYPHAGWKYVQLVSELHGLLYQELFSFLPMVNLFSLSSSSSSIEGGDQLIVYGRGFNTYLDLFDLQCAFGEGKTNAIIVNDTTVSCEVPLSGKDGSVSLKLLANSTVIHSQSLIYNYHANINIFDYSPKRVHYESGSVIEVFGSNLCDEESNIMCVFGNFTSVPLSTDCSIIQCLSPAGLNGNHSFGLQIGQKPIFFDEYLLFESAIQIVSIFPSFAFATDKETILQVIISHAVSKESLLSCVIGIEDFPAEISLDGNKILCRIRTLSIGVRQIGIEIDGLVYFSPEVTLTVVPAPIVSSISSSIIPINVDQNNTLLLEGDYFPINEQILCNFSGSFLSAAISISSQQLICPLTGNFSQVGVFPLLLSMNSAIQVFSGYNITISPPIQLLSLSSTMFDLKPVNTLLLYGINFPENATYDCNLEAKSYSARWVSPTVIECYLVNVAEGNYSVTLMINGLSFPLNWSRTVRFSSMGTILSVNPLVGHSAGSTVITVIGDEFLATDDIRCTFDDLETIGTFLNSSTIHCQSPPHPVGFVAFGVVINNIFVSAVTENIAFNYVPSPQISNIYPSVLTGESGLVLFIYGSNFLAQGFYDCLFDGAYSTKAVVHNSTTLSCNSPSMNSSGDLLLSVRYGAGFTTESLPITIAGAVTITSIKQHRISSSQAEVLVEGIAFPVSRNVECSINNISFNGTVLTENTVSCPLQSWPDSSLLSVSLNFGGHQIEADEQVLKISNPKVFDVVPKVLPNSLPAEITVIGEGFNSYDNPRCWFNLIPMEAVVLDNQTMTCSIPTISWTGDMQLSFEFFGSILLNNLTTLQFTNAPVIRSVSLNQLTDSSFVFTVIGWNLEGCGLQIACGLNSAQDTSEWKLVSDNLAKCIIPLNASKGSLFVTLPQWNFMLFEQDMSYFNFINKTDIELWTTYASENSAAAVQLFTSTSNFPSDASCVFSDQSYDIVIISDDIAQCSIFTGSFEQNRGDPLVISSDSLGVLQQFNFTVLPSLFIANVNVSTESSIHGEDAKDMMTELLITMKNFEDVADLSDLSINWYCYAGELIYTAYIVDTVNTLYCSIPTLSLCSTGNLQIGYDRVITSPLYSVENLLSCENLVSFPYIATPLGSPDFIVDNQSVFYPIGQEFQSLSESYSVQNGSAFRLSSEFFVEEKQEADCFVYNIDISSQTSLSSSFSETFCQVNRSSCFGSEVYDIRATSKTIPTPLQISSDRLLNDFEGGPLLVSSVSPKIISDDNDTWVTVTGENFNFYTKCQLNTGVLLRTIVLSSTSLNCLVPPLNITQSFVLELNIISSIHSNSTSASAGRFSPLTTMYLVYQFTFNKHFPTADLTKIHTPAIQSNPLNSFTNTLCLSKTGCTATMFPNLTTSSEISAKRWMEYRDLDANASETTIDSFELLNETVSTSIETLSIFSVFPDSCLYPCENVWIQFFGYGWQEVLATTEIQFCMVINTQTVNCEFSLQDEMSLYCPLPEIPLPPSNYSVELLFDCQNSVYNTTFVIRWSGDGDFSPTSGGRSNPAPELPQIVSIIPTFSWLNGGGVLKLLGKNIESNITNCFFQLSDESVDSASFDDNYLTAAYVDVGNQLIVCSVPQVFFADENAEVFLINQDSNLFSTGFKFAFLQEPLYYSIQWSNYVNNSIEVIGSGFQQFHQVFCKLHYVDQTSYLVSGTVYSDTELICEQIPLLYKVWNSFISSVSISFNGVDFSVPLALNTTFSSVPNADSTTSMLVSAILEQAVVLPRSSPHTTEFSLSETILNPPTLTLNCSQINYVPFELDNLRIDTNYSCLLDGNNLFVSFSNFILSNQRFCIIDPLGPGNHQVELVSGSNYHAPITQIVICQPDPVVLDIIMMPTADLNQIVQERITNFLFVGHNFASSASLECRLNHELISAISIDTSRSMACSFVGLLPGNIYKLAVIYGQKAIASVNFCATNALLQAGGSVVEVTTSTNCAVDGLVDPNAVLVVPEQKIYNSIRSVFPSSGIASGNTMLKIVADRIYYDESINCIFDGRVIVPAVVAGNDYVLCKSPSHTAGNTTISLQTPDQSKQWCCGKYYYHPFVVITAVEPSSLTGQANAIVMVTVDNSTLTNSWMPSLYCHINQYTTFGSFLDGTRTHFSCKIPAINAPFAKISVGSSEEIWSNTLQLPILRSSALFQLEPNFGAIFGGTPLKITLPPNLELSSSPICIFDSSIEVSGYYLNPNDLSTIICITPSYGKPMRVTVELQDGNSTVAATYYLGEYQFGYLAQSITLSPSSAMRTTETLTIRVFGANFRDSASLKCLSSMPNGGIITFPAIWLSGSLVLCNIPGEDLIARDYISLQVSNNGIDQQPVFLRVNLTNEILITSYQPKRGFTTGGNEIFLTLKYPTYMELFCDFGGLKLPSFQFNTSMIICTAPSHTAGSLTVNLLNQVGIVYDQFNYIYEELPVLSTSRSNAIIQGMSSAIRFTGSNISSFLRGILLDVDGNSVNGECFTVAVANSSAYFTCQSVFYEGSDDFLFLSVTNNEISFVDNVTVVPVFTSSNVIWMDPLYAFAKGGEGYFSVGLDQLEPGSATVCIFGINGDNLVVIPELIDEAIIRCAIPIFSNNDVIPVSFSLSQYGNVIYGPLPITVIELPEIESLLPQVIIRGIPQPIHIAFVNPVGYFPTLNLYMDGKVENLTRWNNTAAVSTITAFDTGIFPVSLFFQEIPGYQFPVLANITVIDTANDISVDRLAMIAGSWTNLTFTSQQCQFYDLLNTSTRNALTCEVSSGECQIILVSPCEATAQMIVYLGTELAELSLCLDEYCSPTLYFNLIRILPSVSIILVNPPIGVIAGGSLISVYGYGFVPDGSLTCLFGSVRSPAFVVNSSLVQCILPVSTVIGNVSVNLMRQETVISQSVAIFEYIPKITQIIVQPTVLAPSGGTVVTITTQALIINDTLECRFNQKRTPAVIINTTSVSCLSPAFDIPQVEFALAYAGADLSESTELTIQQSIHSIYIDPVSFIANMPVNISIYFDTLPGYLATQLQCEIDSIVYPSSVVNNLTVVCSIEDGLSNEVHQLQLLANNLLVFEYPLTASAPFAIYSAFPTKMYSTQSVSMDVTTTADLISENNEYVTCCFGNLRSPALLISPTQWRCYTPTFDSGGIQQAISLPIGVALGDQGFCEMSGFSATFYTPIVITGQSITNGATSGGDAIYLYTNWNYALSMIYCRIGTSVLIGQALPQGVLCITEASVPGIFSLDLSVNGVNFLPSGAYFEFISPSPPSADSPALIPPVIQPAIYRLGQNSFPAANQFTVDVYGINYGVDSSCVLDGLLMLVTTFIDSTHLQCVLPVHAVGPASLSVVSGDPKYSNSFTITFTGTPRISSISQNIMPSYGPRTSSSIVQIVVEDLSAYEGNTIYCLTGDQWSLAFAIEERTVNCTIQEWPILGNIKVQLGSANHDLFPGAAYFHFIDDPLVFDIQPKQGTGLADVLLIGKGFSKFPSLSIQFGDIPSFCNIISDIKMICKVPPDMAANSYLISVQTNGQHLIMSGLFFEYFTPIQLLNLWPLNGPAMRGGTIISINGTSFPNSQDLYCIIDAAKVLAEYVNSTMIRCRTPPHKPAMINIAVALDGVLLHPYDQALNFLYTPDVSVDLISPNVGYTAGEFPIFVFGSNFLNTTALGCQFADMQSRGIYLSNTSLMCLLPSPLGRSALYDLSNVTVEVTVNGYDYSQSGVIFSYSQPCDQGFFCPGLNRQLCPNGTYCPVNSRNFTLCAPGTFQPQQGQTGCVICPVGYLCPDLGMPRPIVCPPGLICDIMGLQESTTLCPSGMYCLNGTKASSLDEFADAEWIQDYTTGVKYFNSSSQNWGFTQWPYPAVGQSRASAPPETSCDGLVCAGGTSNFLAEAPFPCPIGHYCRTGVGNQIPMPKNFSSPQRCFDGFFCPRGSISPEGSGPCPNGYFCPTQLDAIICPQGHYCPGVGNTDPVECYPGTYNPFPGQANCTVCPSGYICPGWGLLLPELCPQGFVCMSLGLSYPVAVCPQGYRCGEGTRTIDPSDSTPYRPVVCGAGQFCLGGVFSLTVIPWIGTSPYGVTHPQECSEGTYCEAGAYLSSGSGLCFVGHYCPPNSTFPTAVPVGNFASGLGSVAATLCYPGTYAPLNASVTCDPCPSGYTCITYGTYIPTICVAGTYRSQVDSVTCTSCPTGTYSYETGAPDLSMCLPCPKGRLCPVKQLITLAGTSSCPDGYICGYASDTSSQFNHLAPAGYHTASASPPEIQYDSQCEAGFYCPRGTPTYLQFGGKCTVGYFCPLASPASIIADNACPVLTTSVSQASTVLNCSINPVDVCDKSFIDPTNPMDDVTYYSSFTYSKLDGTGTVILDSSLGAVNPTGELQVPIKVHPVNVSASSPQYLNDTIEAFRTCPLYGSGDGNDKILIIGRNFIDNKLNYCKFRACFFSNRGRSLRRCKNQLNQADGADLPKVGNVSEQTFITRAKYISPTRMECSTPQFLFNYDFNATFAENLYECQYLDAFGVPTTAEYGNLSYVRLCDADTSCMNKPMVGYEFFISLTFPCSVVDINDGVCTNTPELNYMFNPCMSGEAVVEVTNDGQTYSGGVELHGTSVLSTARWGDGRPIYDFFKNYTINATFAVYTYVYPEYMYTNPQILEMERRYCELPRYSEEAPRLREEGWFRLQSNEVALLSFDFTTIPSSVIYNQHYRIAIFAIPSRCDEQLCSAARVRLSPQEYVPCLTPMPFSYWFENMQTYNVVVNLTVFALDDLIFKVEIHVLYGLFEPMAPLFVNSTTVQIVSPARAKSLVAVDIDNTYHRQLTKYVSFEQQLVPMQYWWCAVVYQSDSDNVSPPYNLPPLYSAYQYGRALIMNNVSANNPNVQLVFDPSSITQPGVEFWYAPSATPDESKEQLDAYFETFHDTSYDPVLGYTFNFDTLVISYFPYFSNCYTFDSYIPIWFAFQGEECTLPDYYVNTWPRYKYPALPDQDSLNYAGPFDFFDDPISEWCERTIQCNYEEDLTTADSTPRWYESGTGSDLFHLIRYPLHYFEYTGRVGIGVSPYDAGGGAYANQLSAISGDNFIPIVINHTIGDAIPGCSSGCMARSYILTINYYQEDLYNKRIILASLNENNFDFNTSNTAYSLHFSYSGFGFLDLIMNFAYPLSIFVVIFIFAGIVTVWLSWIFWLINRIFTTLQNPPQLRILTMLPLIVPPAATGTYLAVVVIWIMTSTGNYFINGEFYSNPNTPTESALGAQLLDAYPLTYNQLGPAVLTSAMQGARYGRVGAMFFILGFFCFFAASRMFFSRQESKREHEVAEKRTMLAKKEHLWLPVRWKKLNFILWSFIIATVLVSVVEISIFWPYYGTDFYQVLIMMFVFGEVNRNILDYFLSDQLLIEPVAACWSFAQSLIAFGAPNFYQFVLSNFFDWIVTTFQRLYQDAYVSLIFDGMKKALDITVDLMMMYLPKYLHPLQANEYKAKKADELKEYKKRQVEGVAETEDESESVEPIIIYFADICGDTCITYYFPYVVYLLMLYRLAIQIPIEYGIRQSDMVIYMVYQLFLILFQPFIDCINHSQIELFRGWKVYEYLVYSRYRFIQREARWKGMEGSLDECIEEYLRRIDQMCFSSQYFFMMTIQMNGMVYIVLAYEVWLRNTYYPMSDAGFFPLLGLLLGCYVGLEFFIFYVAKHFGIWRIKHEGTAWHIIQDGAEAELDVPAWEEIKGASSEAFIMNQRITSETFRYKFLNYNRTWLINQLPQILTPRTLRRSRPYLINQFARIINARREDISDDDKSDEEKEKKFGPVALSTSSRNIIRHWLGKARRRLKLRTTVEPIIKRARGAQCEQCLSRKQLQIEYEVDLDAMITMYDRTYPGDEEVDQVQWKTFWVNNQRYHTICLACLTKRKELDARNKIKGGNVFDPTLFDDDNEQEQYPEWGPVFLSGPSKAILLNWYRKAQKLRAGKKQRRQRREKVVRDFSDDEGDDPMFQWLKEGLKEITPASKAIALRWMRTARARLQQKRGKGAGLRESDLPDDTAENVTETFKSGRKSKMLKK